MVQNDIVNRNAVDIESLFYHNRFPGGLSFLFILFYAPLGLFLVSVRLFIGFNAYIAACILPKFSLIRHLVLRIMCTLLGIFVWYEEEKTQISSVQCEQENSQNSLVEYSNSNHKSAVKIYAANYTSALDHVAVDLVVPCYTPCVWDFPSFLVWILGYVNFGAKQGRATLIRNTEQFIKESKSSILTFPEGASTNGKVGLLKFSTWPFSLKHPITPIAITLKRPFITDISPSVLGGRWWIDLFWFLFVPFTVFKIRILKTEFQGESESLKDFTDRIQKIIANCLRVESTKYTSVEKFVYAKQKLLVEDTDTTIQVLNRSLSQSSIDLDLNLMLRQVRDVLPYIPNHIIEADLVKTRCVDDTIVNLLEKTTTGSLTEDSFKNSSHTKPVDKVIVKQEPKDLSNIHTSKILTFKERKQLLYDTAKLKYMSKHNLI